MGRKKIDLSEKRKENIKSVIETILKENNLNQVELADKIHCQPELISRMKHGSNLTKSTALAIIEAFPDKNYPEDWLRGLTPYRTSSEKFKAEIDEMRRLFKEGAENQNMIRKAVAVMMRFYGVDWNGEIPPMNYEIIDGKRYRLPDQPVATYNGIDFYSWELGFIADKIFEDVGRELQLASKFKEPDEHIHSTRTTLTAKSNVSFTIPSKSKKPSSET